MILKRVLFFIICIIFASVSGARVMGADSAPPNAVQTCANAFVPAEKLTYSISWSNIVRAGIAVMEVKEGQTIGGRRTYQFTSRTHSVGLLDTFYPVQDTVESIVDANDLCSLTFHLQENHGKRKRRRQLTFDRENGTVRQALNDDKPETYSVPECVQDALSSLYYVRTRQDFHAGKPIILDVFDGGKTWSVEVQTLGKERIKTPAGEFDTIEVKTYPKYEGVFKHKGEIYIWLTDDARKIPVQMKSVISIGSIIATLTGIEGRKDKP